MEILLISPTIGHTEDISKSWSNFNYPPIGLHILAALTPDKHKVTVIDESIREKIDFDKHYDLVGIGAMTPQVLRGYEIAKRFKEKNIKVIMGGYHISLFPEDASGLCDSICIGEAENIWLEILKDAENNELKAIYKSAAFTDLAKVPWLDRTQFAQKHYSFLSKNVIQASRGCPFNCSFCTVNKFFGNQYRFRPVPDIIEEIKYMKENKCLPYGIVDFLDDNIIANPGLAKELFKALIPLKIKWMAECTINIVKDPELLALAKESGCMALLFGFESVTNESLQSANKKIADIDLYIKGIKMLQEKKIQIMGSFIFGFDSDDKTVFDKTVEFIEDNNIQIFVFNILTPLPGTVIYDQYAKEGRLLHKNWSYYDSTNVVFRPMQMTPEELLEGYNKASRRLAAYKSIFKRSFGAKNNFILTFLTNLGYRSANKYLTKNVYYAQE